MGPQGPAGFGAAYVAGAVKFDATVKFGAGFTVARNGSVGGYRVTVAPTSTGHQLVALVTQLTANAIARVVAYTLNANGTHTIDVEVRDLSGRLLDSDFNFVAIDRS